VVSSADIRDHRRRPESRVRPRTAARVWYAAGAAGLFATNLLVLSGVAAGARAVVGLATVVTVPGAIASRALRLPVRRGWDWVLHAVALSLAGLIAVAFVTSLPAFGPPTPLRCLAGLDLLVAALVAAESLANGAAARRWAGWGRRWVPCRPVRTAPGRRWRGIGPALRGLARARLAPRGLAPRGPDAGWAALGVVLAAAAVPLAVAGAHRLNAGGPAWLSEAALACAIAAVGAAARGARRRQHPGAAGAAIYLLALAVLLATSLRGTGVTGHDIKIEYRVLAETLDRGSWQPGGAFPGYNSCLSITVLPAFLARLLGIAPLDVFRVCFQTLFATVPVGVFLLIRRWLPGGSPVLGAGLFVAFPGYVNDMSMLNRQEIALIFFTAAMLGLVQPRGTVRQRVTGFAVLAVGLTVSHYSSTYVAAGLLLMAWSLRQLRRVLSGRAAGIPPAHAALGLAGVLLVALAVAWAAAAGSADALGGGLRSAALSVAQRTGAYSSPAHQAAAPPPAYLTDAQALRTYAGQLRGQPAAAGAAAPPVRCAPRALPPDRLAETAGGRLLARAGLDPVWLNGVLRQGAAALFEGGAVLGAALLMVRELRRARRRPGRGLRVLPDLAVAALAMLALTVVAPQLADSYGPQRLYQQSLVLLAPAVLIALVVPARWVRGRLRRGAAGRRPAVVADAVVASVVVGCFFTTSGLLPNLTGGYLPQLNLNNSGAYFRAYYAAPADLAVTRWIAGRIAAPAVVAADSRDSANLRAMTRLYPLEGLVPGAVPPDGYVEVATPDGRAAAATAILGDRIVRYTFPLECVSTGRTLLFATGQHRVYGPVREQ
jgi:hypothetical protein